MARFLGYDIKVSRSQQLNRRKDGIKSETYSGVCYLNVPQEAWVKKLLNLGALRITKENRWKPQGRTYLRNHDDLEILSIYNAEIRGMYNYYKLANNVSTLNQFYYFMKFSMYKTFGAKYRTVTSRILKKYKINGKFGVKYETKQGKKIRFLYDEGFKKASISEKNRVEVDTLPNTFKYNSKGSLVDRLRANKCEWCGKGHIPVHMHHIRKLKDLKGKKQWEKFMLARKRKTIAMCMQCHVNLHAGRLD